MTDEKMKEIKELSKMEKKNIVLRPPKPEKAKPPAKKSVRLNRLQSFKLMTFVSNLELKDGRLLASYAKVAAIATRELKLDIEYNLGHVREACESLGIKPKEDKPAKKEDVLLDMQQELRKCLNNNAARLAKMEQFLEHVWGKEYTSFTAE